MSAYDPCGHEPPQSPSALHGVCIFCWRDRYGATVASLRDALATWSFDAAQHPTHTWHDREDWIARHPIVETLRKETT